MMHIIMPGSSKRNHVEGQVFKFIYRYNFNTMYAIVIVFSIMIMFI
jgi:hypothetical protein